MPDKKIRVLVVDDSILMRTILINGLSASPRLEVIGSAINASDATRKIQELKPDVVTMDVEMPGMTGIDLLKQLLPKHPVPVILVSSLNLRVFDALAAGAVDFVRKPDGNTSQPEFISTLIQKVVVASAARVSPRRPAPSLSGILPAYRPGRTQVVIGLGASTGGTEATLSVLQRLPADIPPMVVVQHMPPGFTKMYAERLDRICKMRVQEACDGDRLERGLVYIAPADLQAQVVRVGADYRLSCKSGEKVSGHRPSVDVLFQSMATAVQCKMVGIIMTGMGRDGAQGLLQMRKNGAFTIGQDKESCVVYGMPMAAQEIGAVHTQASCENIAGVLLRHLNTLG